MDATTVYYLASTIAQVLASAIALLGALVLYRLQSATLEIEEQGRKLVGNVYSGQPEQQALTAYLGVGNYDAIEQHYRLPEFRHAAVLSGGAFETPHRLLGVALRFRGGLIRTFRNALWSTAGMLASSIALIPLAPVIVTSCGKIPVILLAIAGFLWCLYSYTQLVSAVLDI